jgi:hypothetical protein
MVRRVGLAVVVLACSTAATAAGVLAERGQSATRTPAARRDIDRDGLSDRLEVRRYRTDPRRRDTDRDGLSDGDEVFRYHTNPRERDTDRDGYGDRAEVRQGTNPRTARSRPGYPGDDTTGVPRGTVLSAYRGPSIISTPNTVIVAKTLGCIRVKAPGVVIRRSRISCGNGEPLAVTSADGDFNGRPLLLEDTEVDCQNTNGTAIGDSNVVARRLSIHGCENGFDINQNVTIEDSYIHDLYNSTDSHTDGIQFAAGHFVNGDLVSGVLNVTIRHNTIYGVGADGSFGTSAIISNHGGDTNVLIENNLLAGGAFTLYCEQDATGINYRVLKNQFTRKFGPKVGFYGPSTDCADETQSGNAYHETRQRLRLR